uniref:C2H2-type domain-containing protein n=1 Tax=Panagrolaimus sp. ES5 TaxID=591445 RepID=A0AC34FQ37_9BILA
MWRTVGKIMQYIEPDSIRPLFGARNVVDLMFARIGNFDTKWSGDTAPELLQYKSCENHFNELFFSWAKFHLKTTRVKGICKIHQAEIVAMAEQQKEEKMDDSFCPVNLVENDSEQKDISSQLTIKKLADSFDIKKFVTSCDYNSLAPDTQRKKINSAKYLFLQIAGAVAPNEENQFLEKVCKAFVEPAKNDFQTALLQNVADQYLKAMDDKMLKLYALSTVADLVSLTEMSKHIPNLTEHYFYEARKLKKMVKLPPFDKKKTYIKYDTYKISKFLDFVMSPFCMITLPFGQKVLTLSDGTKLDIPNKMRIQRSSQILRMYKGKAAEEGETHLLLPDSTMYGILQKCYATQSKSLTCVDYYIAAGLEAFDKLAEVVTRWYEKQLVEADTAASLKKRLQQGQNYLRTDFKVNLALHSNVLSHCLRFALSDPTDSAFQQQCLPEERHLTLCDRCEALHNVLQEMNKTAENFLKNVIRSEGNMLEVEEMERHAYDAKHGMSYSIIHVAAKVEEKTVEHTYVHIIKAAKQDNMPVIAMLHDVLQHLKKIGVSAITVRSDNAGCYHSAQTMMSLKQIAKETGVSILRWSFSEAQNGKSSSDQKASVMKGRVRNYVHDKNDVTTEEDFFKALTTPFPVNYTTINLATILRPKKEIKAKALPGISTFSEFVLETDGIRVFKFKDIGKGKLFPYGSYKPVETLPKLSSSSEINVLNPKDLSVGEDVTPTQSSEKAAISNGQKTFFWRVTRPSTRNEVGVQYYCPENLCIAKFSTMGELVEHMHLNKHQYYPERMTQLDFAMKYYAENLNAGDCDDCPENIIRNNIVKEGLITNMGRLKEGWAHKKPRVFPKLTVAVKTFLQKIFDEGEADSAKKSSPEAAERKMIAARQQNGKAQFRPEEVLKISQIKSYFSYLKKERSKCLNPPPAKKPCPLPDPSTDSYDESDDDDDEEEEVTAETTDISESTIRRSQRIINLHNSYIRREYEENVDNMAQKVAHPLDLDE